MYYIGTNIRLRSYDKTFLDVCLVSTVYTLIDILKALGNILDNMILPILIHYLCWIQYSKIQMSWNDVTSKKLQNVKINGVNEI